MRTPHRAGGGGSGARDAVGGRGPRTRAWPGAVPRGGDGGSGARDAVDGRGPRTRAWPGAVPRGGGGGAVEQAEGCYTAADSSAPDDSGKWVRIPHGPATVSGERAAHGRRWAPVTVLGAANAPREFRTSETRNAAARSRRHGKTLPFRVDPRVRRPIVERVAQPRGPACPSANFGAWTRREEVPACHDTSLWPRSARCTGDEWAFRELVVEHFHRSPWAPRFAEGRRCARSVREALGAVHRATTVRERGARPGALHIIRGAAAGVPAVAGAASETSI